MFTRPWIAMLLLINYLLVVGMSFVSRPEDQSELVRVQTSEEGHFYQQCRYMRMDGLEAFLAESLASHYQNAPKAQNHHLISLVSGVNAHYLVHTTWQLLPPTYRVETPVFAYLWILSEGISPIFCTPPWQA